ncbi:protein mono-ADP-ribosyltransferase PARP14-like [Octopus vulgaris]|uniref:Poly [ADP-ribose] polymerase n=1 Tax=Octopus vulgaris TaxID=6645 RepID=A0AA36EVG5_OCTVU|nr:protein mono-ADP-ribosyltransferase PARP14-like [Octopus vulgaris]
MMEKYSRGDRRKRNPRHNAPAPDIFGTFKSQADQRHFYFDNRNFQANILGIDKSNMIKFKNKLLDYFRRIYEDDLSIHERRILSGLRFFEQAERQSEGLQVRIHGNKVIFEGQYSEVATCHKCMYKILQSIVKSELCLPLNTGMIINKKPVKEYLDGKLRNKKCIGSWETGDGDSVLLYASDKTHLSLLEEIMKEFFVVNTLDFVDKIKDTPNHGKWLTFVESLKEEFPDFCFIGEDSIVAVDAVVNDIKSKIDNFKQSLIYESYISINLAHFLFLKEFKEQEINDFSEENKIKNVCLKDNKLHLEGTQNQIRKMETFIENLRKDISSKEENFEMFGLQEFLESEEGKNFLCEMQKKSESIILNSNLGSETEEIVNVDYKNCEIVLREGDITTLDTDAIVNAANGRLEHRGGVAAAIVQKDTASSNASLPGSQQEPSSMTPRTNETSRENAGIEINLTIGSITNASVDVIVNSTNEELQLDSGAISKYILFAAGPQIQDECNQKYPQGISTSKIAITKGYNLKCKNVFHLALPPWDENSSDSKFDEYLQNKQENEGFHSKDTASSNASLPGSQQEPSSMTPRTNVASGEYGRINIKPINDSITNAYLDVIVNSTNKNLELNNGSISKFILFAAGPEIQNECNQRYPQGISTSKIAVTKGYNLNCKNVFHLVLPPWDENSPDLILANLTQIITTCLEKAERMGAKSLAFPILGAGTLKYPIEELPRTMYEAVKNYSNQNSSQIKVVNFVVYPQDTEIAKLFHEYLQNKQENEGFHSKDDEDIDDKDDEDEEIEDNVSAGQKDVGVTLKFFAEYQNLDNAIETVKKEYDSLLTTEKIPFDVDLTESRKLSLRNISRTHKIQISISETITIYGRHSLVKDAKLSVQSLLMEFKETDEETLIKKMVQWSYFEENFPENVRMFSDKENAKLEKAYSLKKKFLDWNNRRYDFQKMSFQHGGSKFKMKRKQKPKEDLIPDTWSLMEDGELIKIVPVTNGPEYDDIQTTFSRNLPSYRIIKIERIQNKTLYHGYQALKRKFEVENPNVTNEVDGLWHGTAEGAVDGINKSGFNRSYCGKNATAFGNGVYFARRIHYSANDKYSVPDANKIKRIYKCSVLVGRMMQGHQGLKFLQDSYNSAVDNIQRPSIYVIFHDFQAYPNYLITFSVLK